MKKRHIALKGKLFLNKEKISSLGTEMQQEIKGGYEPVISLYNNNGHGGYCTSIERFGPSFDSPCDALPPTNPPTEPQPTDIFILP